MKPVINVSNMAYISLHIDVFKKTPKQPVITSVLDHATLCGLVIDQNIGIFEGSQKTLICSLKNVHSFDLNHHHKPEFHKSAMFGLLITYY